MLDGAVRDQSPHTPVEEEPAPWATGRNCNLCHAMSRGVGTYSTAYRRQARLGGR